MKFLCRLIVLSFLLCLCFTQCQKEEPEPEELIPDLNFLKALIERNIDLNADGMISPDEAALVTELNVSFCDITDMKGIEAFINLEILKCNHNPFRVLDISQNTSLEELHCVSTRVGRIDATGLTRLRYLNCQANLMGSLVVANCPSLPWRCRWIERAAPTSILPRSAVNKDFLPPVRCYGVHGRKSQRLLLHRVHSSKFTSITIRLLNFNA